MTSFFRFSTNSLVLSAFICTSGLFGSFQSAHAILPLKGDPRLWESVNASEMPAITSGALNLRYQVGSEWGKKPVTPQSLEKESASFKRAAMATAKMGGGTAFYLGKFNGHHVMATNHHVLTNAGACLNRSAQFTLLGKNYVCIKFFGEWSDIDLALFEIAVPEADEHLLQPVAGNFAFHKPLKAGEPLITIGYGIAENPGRKLMANQDSDCKVFSDDRDYRFISDPDALNPADYQAWSFANGCDISHGDSGSAMVDRDTSEVVGIIWTGRIPKDASVQDSAYLDKILAEKSPAIWEHLSYAIPAEKIGDYLQGLVNQGQLEADTQKTFEELLR